MKSFFLILLTLFLCVSSFAETTINVHVTDKDGNPVSNAKVEVKGIVPWEEESFLETIGVDFLDCFEAMGIKFDSLDLYTHFNCYETEDGSNCIGGLIKEAYEQLEYCGYFEDLNAWEYFFREHEGRFKYEHITTVTTDSKGYARIEADGYVEYRVEVSNSVRFFRDGTTNLNMNVTTDADVVRTFFLEWLGNGNTPSFWDKYKKDWIIYVVKSNPYFDIRKSFPNNDRMLQPEDILKYYTEIHDIRFFDKETYSKYYLSHNAFLHHHELILSVERSLFLYLEQGEYQFILSSADGHIIVDDVDTRTVRSEYLRARWEKDSEGRWLLYFYVDINRDYKAKTPPDNIQIPTVITPYTQDGLNDDFLPGYEVEIFDYYGNFVSSSANGWDGRKGSDLAPPGIYFYKVKLKDGRKRKGTVEVIKM